MKLFTIGFTKKSAEKFFSMLCDAGIMRLIDIRLNNVSQLAGFAKRDDLRYFLKTICGIQYIHVPELAPTEEIFSAYKNKGDWKVLERDFNKLLKTRKVEKTLSPGMFDKSCLLCSEDKPEKCHRSLVVDYLKKHWGEMDVTHLL